MKARKYKYLLRLMAVIILVLAVMTTLFTTLFWTRSFEEIRKGNETYYEKLLDSLVSHFDREVIRLRDYAAQISVDSRNADSPFWEGAASYRENAYWYFEAVRELKDQYSRHRVSDCGIYYYDLDSIITKGAKQTREEFVVHTLQAGEGQRQEIDALFSEEQYQPMRLLYGTTNTEENVDGEFLLGYCTTMGKNKDKVMILFVISAYDFLEMLDVGSPVEGVEYYVLDQRADRILLAMGEEPDPARLAGEDAGRRSGGMRQRVVYRSEESYLALSFALCLTEDSLSENIAVFYRDMQQRMIWIVLFMLCICFLALYVEYRPMRRILAELDQEEGDEFTVIRNALDNRQAILKEQELLIMDLLVNHLIAGIPVTEEQLKKLGMQSPASHYCVYILEGHILLTGELEQFTREMECRFSIRLFAVDLQGANSNVFITFLADQDTEGMESWMREWFQRRLGTQWALYVGKVVDGLDEIRASFLDCREKRKEQEEARKAIQADLDALRLKEEQQRKKKEDILAYLAIHYRDPDLSQTQVADAFQISNYTLSRMFKLRVGVGFSEYVNSKRLEYAKELLLTTEYSIHDIARMVGFSSDNYFSRIFKANVGVSPTVFREK